jgi:hypothetical protein
MFVGTGLNPDYINHDVQLQDHGYSDTDSNLPQASTDHVSNRFGEQLLKI